MQDSDVIDRTEIISSLEALVFASGEPISYRDIKKVFERYWREEPDERREKMLAEVRPALQELQERWPESETAARGFSLVEVAGAYTFRSHPRHADVLRAMREERPVRLSKAALETLSIVAYRQPVTKAEVDYVRGVDSGGTTRILLDKGLLRVVGKKDEPGRPLLYGTTREFLSFFNLNSLKDLPSLREYRDLTEESSELLTEFDAQSTVDALQSTVKKLQHGSEPIVDDLDTALQELTDTETTTREAFALQGISIDPNTGTPENE